jgi:hypothetical protein
VTGDVHPARSVDGQAVIAFPEHIDVSNADRIGEELLSAVNYGTTTLIADMTATLSCDHGRVLVPGRGAGARSPASRHRGAAGRGPAPGPAPSCSPGPGIDAEHIAAAARELAGG